MKVEWVEPAELDLGDIYSHIARDVPIYAEQFIDQILHTASLLHEQPLMARSPRGKTQRCARTAFSQLPYYLFSKNWLSLYCCGDSR